MAKALIVEDEEHIASGLAFNLEAEGHASTVARDGADAVRLFHEARAAARPFELVVLDLMLPRMSGYEVCDSIRRVDRHVPVLVLSAKAQSDDRIAAFGVGANQYLHKPFRLEELLARVRNLLEAPRPAAAPAPLSDTLDFGGATVNFRTHEVAVRGAPRKLTPLQLQLLRLFADNEGTVLARDDIYAKVWGRRMLPTTARVVDNALMALRKTFEDDPARPRHFHSVRGAGYRFVRSAGPDDGAAS
jgi:two-component system, OmpR family, alkaline phosphatase synthesis response regulator PhoP